MSVKISEKSGFLSVALCSIDQDIYMDRYGLRCI